MRQVLIILSLAVAALACPGPARAIMSGQESRLAPSSDPDYAAGKAAFEAGDWQAVVAHMTMVLVGRPWHDNAETMLAYAWRKLGRYDLALEHYAEALGRNPRNRDALEYLAEAYLDLGRGEEADATVLRLAKVCDEVVMAFDNTGWKSGCEQLNEVKEVYAERGRPLPTFD